jgi:hypothetical protein
MRILEVDMKKLALAAVLATVGTAAFASGYTTPIVEPEVVVAHSSSSVGGIVIPLLLLLVIAAVAL